MTKNTKDVRRKEAGGRTEKLSWSVKKASFKRKERLAL